MQLKHWLRNDITTNFTLYLFLVILFIIGIIFGAIIVNSMNFVQKQELYFYLEQFFNQQIKNNDTHFWASIQSSFSFHSKYLIAIFILSFTIIGLPVILMMLFSKAVVIGFTVGFLVNQLGSKGFYLAILSIVPQNIITIPIYIFACSIAIQFTFLLIKKLFIKNFAELNKQILLRYAVLFFICILFSIVSSLIESTISIYGLSSIVKTLSQTTELFLQ